MLQIKHNKVRMTEKRRTILMGAMFHAFQLGIAEIDATIRINFRKGYQKTHDKMADCVPLANKTIVINIDCDMPKHMVNCAIAHEMVHAKQYIVGELGYNKVGAFTWNGKKVSKKLAYHETPWEVEAMSKEILMAHKFNHFLETL